MAKHRSDCMDYDNVSEINFNQQGEGLSIYIILFDTSYKHSSNLISLTCHSLLYVELAF